ncbi:hypothetical protein [Massilia sp. CCM 8734]|uniref:hypothetical protein n=1 Tax=Massilia sp. CCM 8734 TaxID=2609283 RepID=UPI00141F85D3|nr:hypothetical protein [Massilia sp. CCM 8734]NHZ96851.1 hypothetical protein [Massilia sp. CCM 8734]
MNAPRHLALLLALLSAAGSASTRAAAAEWLSYRDAYRAMIVFEKYGRPKNYLQNQIQLVPARKGTLPEDIELSLQLKDSTVQLPLDPIGRAVFPVLKVAFDENAPLLIDGGTGPVSFRVRISIMPRADGVYDSAELRAACAQALDYQRYTGASVRACVGVRFVYPLDGPAPQLRVRGNGQPALLPVALGSAFPGDEHGAYRVVNYRFADAAGAGQVLAPSPPLAIAPLIE